MLTSGIDVLHIESLSWKRVLKFSVKDQMFTVLDSFREILSDFAREPAVNSDHFVKLVLVCGLAQEKGNAEVTKIRRPTVVQSDSQLHDIMTGDLNCSSG